MKDQGKSRAGRRIITSFVIVLCLAIIFIGIAAFFMIQKRSGMEVDDRTLQLIQCLALASVFLLVLDFGHVLPRLFRKDRFADENTMRQAIAKYLPNGEVLEAGIYAVVTESDVTVTYKKCRYEKGKLIKDNEAGLFSMEKKKVCEYTVYLGMSQTSLFIVECENNKHYYEYPTRTNIPYESIPELPEDIEEQEVGIKFSLDEIKECKVENGKQGMKLCTLIMQNGTYFKMKLPDNAGPTSNMPHHLEYREKLLGRMAAAL